MYPVKAIRRVVLIKSTKSSETQDRYAILLKENNFIPFNIPTLEFKFQINDLKECLSQPEKYSGPQTIMSKIQYKINLTRFLHRINFN